MSYHIDIPFPSFPLSVKPTPLQPMSNLSLALGSGPLYVKRDDLTGLAFGGNKARQLEWYLGEAKQKKADTILITGAVQSNYVRMAAAAANLAGMECHVQLEDRVKDMSDLYHANGNAFLTRLLGATTHFFFDGEDEEAADRNLEKISAQLRNDGRNPYIIYLGANHPPKGALGYVEASAEILNQSDSKGISLDCIVVSSGTSFTHAGLLVGLRALGSSVQVYGFCVRRDSESQTERVFRSCKALEGMLGLSNRVTRNDVWTSDMHLGKGYGKNTDRTLEAFKLVSKTEGLLLDPVYTVKSMAGLISLARQGNLEDRNTVYWHTGGTPALFAYQKDLFSNLS